jgi:Tol biopolymer transport system component
MALATGTRLGPYEILSAIGAGGMGEVYKARDTRLDRIVAIKILPPAWTSDPAMKERFSREAQTIASLKHPNICVLHDVGRLRVSDASASQGDEIDFLVMEFLDGETLADRLAKGPLPLDDAMTIGIAIADALDKAHRQGVIHRDLKPANVMLVRGGGSSGPSIPKLLDFGLATSRAALPAASNLTLPGMIIGTMQYMAPEQFDGVEADRRTDIFAFGVVLHEMVTGKKTFEGKSQVMLISAIATTEPQPVSRVQPAAPPALDHVVKTCLAKDPADRWQDVRDLLAELQWIAEGGEDAGFPVPASAGRPARRWWRPAALAASVALAAVLAAPAYFYFFRAAPEPEELRFRIPRNLTAEPSETQPGTAPAFATFSPNDSAISPDGSTVAFVARPTTGDTFFLYLRPVGSVTPKKIEGTDDASQPFWSADSQWVVFFHRASGKIKRVLASGAAAQDVGTAPGFQGGSLNAEGTIIFGTASGLFQVPAEGGKPVPLTTIGPSETGHFAPRFLPDGRHYLYLAGSSEPATRAIFAGTLGADEKTKILAADSNAVYTASGSSGGYLVFHNENALYAQPFSAETLTLSGKPVRVANEVMYDATTGRGSFDVSGNGVLIYFANSAGSGGAGGQDTWPLRVMWTDRSASDGGDLGPYFPYRGLELSPDTKRIAVHRHEGNGGDIWIMEPAPTAMRRITFDATQDNSSPIWSPGGDKIAFASNRSGKWGLYQIASDGSGAEELLFESELPKAPMSWSRDGKHLVFWVQDPKTAGDIWVLPMDGEKKPVPLIATVKNETHPQISWDNKWIAYTSDLTGRKEVYVQPFPSGTGRYQVSPDSGPGGDWPRWKRDTKELYYHSLDNVVLGAGIFSAGDTFLGPIFSSSVTVNGSAFVPGTPTEALRVMAIRISHGADYHAFDVSPDGQRFLTLQRVLTTDSATSQFGPELPTAGLTVAMNWMRALRK